MAELGLTSAQVVVYAALVDRMNDKTRLAFPSQSTLSRDTGLDRGTVREAIVSLESHDLIVLQGERRKGAVSRFYVPPTSGFPQREHGDSAARSTGDDLLAQPAGGPGQPAGLTKQVATAPPAGSAPIEVEVTHLPAATAPHESAKRASSAVENHTRPSRDSGLAFAASAATRGPTAQAADAAKPTASGGRPRFDPSHLSPHRLASPGQVNWLCDLDMLIDGVVLTEDQIRAHEALNQVEASERIRERWGEFENVRFHEGGLVDESSYSDEVLRELSPSARAYLQGGRA